MLEEFAQIFYFFIEVLKKINIYTSLKVTQFAMKTLFQGHFCFGGIKGVHCKFFVIWKKLLQINNSLGRYYKLNVSLRQYMYFDLPKFFIRPVTYHGIPPGQHNLCHQRAEILEIGRKSTYQKDDIY